MDPATLLRAKDLAARDLGRRTRSEREVEAYLERRGFSAEIVSRVVRDFRRVGLIDDRAMAREWAERRLASHPSGRLAVGARLRARGLRQETVAEVLDEVYAREPERELVRRAAAAYRPRVGRLPPEVQKRRLFRFLMQRGFSQETLSEFFDEMER